ALGGLWMIWLGGGWTGGRRDVTAISWRTALGIGLFQTLALWPGTSRSMVTIGGGMLLGLSAVAAAEFSFLLGLPTLGAACVHDLTGNLRHGGSSMFAQLGAAPMALGFGVAPVAGRLADILRALRGLLAFCMLAGAAVAVGLVRADGVRVLLAIGLVHAAVVAPTTILADALAVAASRRTTDGFEYGWVRGAASGSFVIGSLVAGQVLGAAPLDAVVWMHAALLGAAALAVPLVPPVDRDAQSRAPVGG